MVVPGGSAPAEVCCAPFSQLRRARLGADGCEIKAPCSKPRWCSRSMFGAVQRQSTLANEVRANWLRFEVVMDLARCSFNSIRAELFEAGPTLRPGQGERQIP